MAPHLLQRAAHRWRRRHPPAQAEWVLGWRNLYVLPTRSGWLLIALLLVLLQASINYQLSLGYLLSFLLTGSVAASVGVAHANLRGLRLQALPPEPVFAGQTVRLQLRLQAPGDAPGRTRRAVFVALGERPSAQDPQAWSWTDVEAGQDAVLELGFSAPQRGHTALPRVTVQTLFPLGAFRLWSHWQPQQQVWVYPAPETPAPPWPATASAPDEASPARSGPSGGDTEIDGVRAYRRGDPLRHIVWKKAAQALATGSDELVSRNHLVQHASHTPWLDESATGLSAPEARLSRLCAWALQLQSTHDRWGLRLAGGRQIAPASGSDHLHQCLQALAEAPGGAVAGPQGTP